MSVASESLNKMRMLVWPVFHRVFKRVSDAYAVTQTTEEEYAATVRESQESLEEKLPEMAFHRTPIASLKIRLDGNISDGSWMYRESRLADRQLHVVLHELEDRGAVDVYAHVEDNWIRHPLLHLRKKNYNAEKGVASVRERFDAYDGTENEIEYEIEPGYQRGGHWALYLVHLVSEPVARRLYHLLSDRNLGVKV